MVSAASLALTFSN